MRFLAVLTTQFLMSISQRLDVDTQTDSMAKLCNVWPCPYTLSLLLSTQFDCLGQIKPVLTEFMNPNDGKKHVFFLYVYSTVSELQKLKGVFM